MVSKHSFSVVGYAASTPTAAVENMIVIKGARGVGQCPRVIKMILALALCAAQAVDVREPRQVEERSWRRDILCELRMTTAGRRPFPRRTMVGRHLSEGRRGPGAGILFEHEWAS